MQVKRSSWALPSSGMARPSCASPAAVPSMATRTPNGGRTVSSVTLRSTTFGTAGWRIDGGSGAAIVARRRRGGWAGVPGGIRLGRRRGGGDRRLRAGGVAGGGGRVVPDRARHEERGRPQRRGHERDGDDADGEIAPRAAAVHRGDDLQERRIVWAVGERAVEMGRGVERCAAAPCGPAELAEPGDRLRVVGSRVPLRVVEPRLELRARGVDPERLQLGDERTLHRRARRRSGLPGARASARSRMRLQRRPTFGCSRSALG